MADATRLGDYFTAHALDVVNAMKAASAQGAAHTVLTHLTETRTTAFTKRDLFRAMPRSEFPAMSDIGPALDLLEEHGPASSPRPTPHHTRRPATLPPLRDPPPHHPRRLPPPTDRTDRTPRPAR
ncbi:hypothetical protein [Streptomyces sp. NPDC023588]|uniref:hypothetical protein n=1 Tax=Streptomyces sp. NPDC023588 TaxID=3154907 RepID=UPI0033FE173C